MGFYEKKTPGIALFANAALLVNRALQIFLMEPIKYKDENEQKEGGATETTALLNEGGEDKSNSCEKM